MPYTKHPQSVQNVFIKRPNSVSTPLAQEGVRQDKGTTNRARRATTQPAPPEKRMRSHALNSKSSRSQTRPTPKRKTVHLTLWVKPGVKAELQRIAAQEGISVSAAGGTYLEQALQQHVDMHYSALLQPIIENAIRQQMRSYSNRIAILLVRSLFASEQTRSLVTNLLGRQHGMTQPVLEQILNGSSTVAKRKITHLTPQLEQLIAEVEQWMEQGGEKTHA
jgi:hypothetical protein